MIHPLKVLKLSALFIAVLSSVSFTDASQNKASKTCPSRTDGLAFGLGVGVKLINLKNIATQGNVTATPLRSADTMSHISSPIFGIYMRQYMPNLVCFPTFWGLEFDYLFNAQKRNLFAKFNAPVTGFDTGIEYREYWNARAMLGAQLWSWSQLDLWAQAGLQITYFRFKGITFETNGVPQNFNMGNKLRSALAPAGGLEVRFCQPGLFANSRVVTDFIVGWTASYRSAISHSATALSGTSYTFTSSANWSHIFGLKVLFRY